MSSTKRLALLKQFSEMVETSSESDTNSSHSEASDDEPVSLELVLASEKKKSNEGRTMYKQIKSQDWYETVLYHYDESRFRHMLRMSKSAFNKLVDQIHKHEVFQQHPGKRPQKPVEFQLAVTLRRLGSKCDVFEVASKFGISEGSVLTYQTRVIKAIKSLKHQYIVWPQGSYKEEIKQAFEDISGFPHVVGAIDGSHIPLFEAPSVKNKEVYFSRKHQYAIHLQAVVDHNSLFIDYVVGWPASVHDAKVFKNSSLHQVDNNLFENEEYLLGDGAYPISKTMIVPFRNAQTHPKTTFNMYHSRGRIAVERAFGKLKGRFKALRELRVKKTRHDIHMVDAA